MPLKMYCTPFSDFTQCSMNRDTDFLCCFSEIQEVNEKSGVSWHLCTGSPLGKLLTLKTVAKCFWTSKKPQFQSWLEAFQMPLEKKLPTISQREDLIL